MKSKIGLYLISGFLGSGKTTFLKDILENLGSKKVGVLINEFSNIGIDGRLIERKGLQLIEINNGSIFCSCLKGDFIHALIELSKLELDTLLIENSGMADPSNIHQILDEVEDRLEKKYIYKGAVCILDSVNFLKQVQVLTPIQNQVAASNFIVINKIDMVNQFTINDIEKKIKEINPSAYIYKTMYARVPLSVLEDKLVDSGYFGETSNKPWNRPVTYSLECEGCFSNEQITEFVRRVEPYAFRIKGFIKGESGWWMIDTVGKDIRINAVKLSKRDVITKTKFVIIGIDKTEIKSDVLKAWEEVMNSENDIHIISNNDLCSTSSPKPLRIKKIKNIKIKSDKEM